MDLTWRATTLGAINGPPRRRPRRIRAMFSGRDQFGWSYPQPQPLGGLPYRTLFLVVFSKHGSVSKYPNWAYSPSKWLFAWRVMINIKGFCLAQKVDVPLSAAWGFGRRKTTGQCLVWGNAKSVGKWGLKNDNPQVHVATMGLGPINLLVVIWQVHFVRSHPISLNFCLAIDFDENSRLFGVISKSW